MYPPVWGKDSFNVGAGMARLYTAAAFVKHNMPLGQGGTLSAQDAVDVAADFTQKPRPDYAAWVKDWPKGGPPEGCTLASVEARPVSAFRTSLRYIKNRRPARGKTISVALASKAGCAEQQVHSAFRPHRLVIDKEPAMQANVGTIDRILRIVIGLVLIGLAATGGIGAWGWIGVLPLLTGIVRVCPAYSILGVKTCSTPKAGAK